ncbi:MAG: MBL fold metallo-hydrolase [Anaerolineae bacterium]|nr:MBL fold metallo-hydrolase [Anaerolineae bacterium]
MIDRIEWLGHASFRIIGSPLIYIDPWRVTRRDTPADIILLTHDHYDHCSPADIEKLRGPNTVIIGNAMVATLVDGVTILRPWQVMNVERVCIKAVPAYNSHHPQQFGGLGYVISVDHYDVYYAGDTDVIPEMPKIRCDVAILPIGGRQTMDANNAVEAVRVLRPRWVIPSHWGNPSEGGTLVDVKQFRQGVESLAEIVLPERVR